LTLFAIAVASMFNVQFLVDLAAIFVAIAPAVLMFELLL